MKDAALCGLLFGLLNLLMLVFPTAGNCQIGGEAGFRFLQVPVTARVSALSGVNITSQDTDVNMFLANPALLNKELTLHASVNYLNYLAGIQYSSVAYAQDFEKWGTWGLGLQYLDYGSFKGYDEAGNEIADFNARDYAIALSHSRTMGLFTFGVTAKFSQSFLGDYTASGLLFDFGGVYKHPQKDFTIGLLVKSLGFLLQDYTEGTNTKMPFDVQIGTTFKPEHMPLRFSVTAYNLVNGNSAYFDSQLGGNQQKPGTVDKIFRHFTIGTEVLLSKNVNVRVGYNHLMRKELRLEETSGGAGFSAGFMVRIKAFEIAYAHRFYHVAGGADSFTLAADLGSFLKRN